MAPIERQVRIRLVPGRVEQNAARRLAHQEFAVRVVAGPGVTAA